MYFKNAERKEAKNRLKKKENKETFVKTNCAADDMEKALEPPKEEEKNEQYSYFLNKVYWQESIL